jgi:glycosyltransferase involved in cell wall biosynthesis
VILPTLDEAQAIAAVVTGCLDHADEVLVVDGASIDGTPERAAAAGARVVGEPRRGFGRACATGAEQARGDVLVYMDADGSFDADDIPRVLAPVLAGVADLCLGARSGGGLPRHLRLANRALGLAVWPACRTRLRDLGPLRAIRRQQLLALGLRDMGYGWPLEMVLRAGRSGLVVREVGVRYGARDGGVSKVTGTVRGTARATVAMGGLILQDLVRGGRR